VPFVERIFEIEQSRGLWDWHLRGVHLWPLIRYQVIRDLYDHQRKYQQVIASADYYQLMQTRHWLRLAKSLRRLRRIKNPEHDCLFLVNRSNRVVNPVTGNLTRLFLDPYIERAPNPLIIETSWPGDPNVQDLYDDPNTLCEHMLWLRWGIGARLHLLTRTEKDKIESFMQQITDLIISNDQLARFVAFLSRFVKCKQRIDLFITRHLQSTLKNRVAFFHCASYLGFRCLWSAALHDAGYRVIEPQHGLIARQHLAYNYPPDLIADPDHPIHRYLPDDFLVFGDRFTNCVRIPGRITSLGLPYMDMIQEIQQSVESKPENILVVSQGTVTDRMVELAGKLASAFPDRTILFKLHPQEVPFESRYKPLQSLPNVQIRTIENILELIAQCPVIVGWYSTTLCESLMFTDRRVFHLEHESVPQGIGDTFETAEQLVELIKQPDRGRSSLDANEFWAKGWPQNYDTFLNDRGIADISTSHSENSDTSS